MPISGKLYYWGDKAKLVPEEPGVYTFYKEDEDLIYIGESSNLRETFAQYLQTNFSEDPCKRETKFYKREFSPNQHDRLMELLEEYQKMHDKLPDCNLVPELDKEVASELGFHFYKGLNEPLQEIALSLQGLKEKIRMVPVASLEFHQRRGDFTNWIKVVMKNPQLAEAIQKVEKVGEDLRTELLILMGDSKVEKCPACGVQTTPLKTWKMAGRPSKAGVRMQLTIGFYKCLSCNKSFRRVLAKEKI